jgi:hypothetical protein
MLAVLISILCIYIQCCVGGAEQQRCAQIFRNKVKGRAVEKGVAFPTCVSVNDCVCNNSPLESEAEAQVYLIPNIYIHKLIICSKVY